MTPPEFSVLLLAWDDADPTVAVLGGAALPPTLPLVYQLAAQQQPVLAVYPHLPTGKIGTDTSPKTAPEPAAGTVPETAATTDSATIAPTSETAAAALATALNRPGVQLLPAPIAKKKAAGLVLQSRIIGLADLVPTAAPATAGNAVAAPKLIPTALRTPLPPPSRSQWPTEANAPALAGQWQAPAAPYLGAGSGGLFLPPPPAPPRPLAAGKSAGVGQKAAMPGFKPLSGVVPTVAISTPTATLRPRQNPQAGDLNFDPDPELPAVQHPAVFEETTEEVGAGEAADLSAPQNDLVPDAAATGAAVPEAAFVAAPAMAGPTVLTPQLDGLNFRMIQYARQAAQLVRGRSDFRVIYAPSWPAWLAALEIRNSSGRPLVLYVASLATDLPNPAEHGYQLEIERMSLRRARLVLVPDEVLRRRLVALYEDAAGKVRVVAANDEAAVQLALGEVAIG